MILTIEKQILSEVFENRVMYLKELREKYFPKITSQVANRKLSRIIKHYPEFLEKIRVERSGLKALRAKPIPGVSTTYVEHDLMLREIKLALHGSLQDDEWLTESLFRIGAICGSGFGKNIDTPKIPDAVWCIRRPGLQYIVIEYERSLKSSIRIKEIIRGYENGTLNLRAVLLFADTTQIANSYNHLKEVFRSNVGITFKSRLHVIDLEKEMKEPFGSNEWRVNLRAVTHRIIFGEEIK